MKKNPLNYRRQTSSKKQKFLINKVGNQSSSLMTRDVSFALTPGAVQSTPFNYLTGIGMRPWEYATRNLSDDLFNGGLDKLRIFLSKLKPLVLIADWRTISDIKSKDFLMLME